MNEWQCLRYNIPGFKEKVIDAISYPEILPNLLIDKYANYVVQSCISIAKKTQRDKFFDVIFNRFLIVFLIILKDPAKKLKDNLERWVRI